MQGVPCTLYPDLSREGTELKQANQDDRNQLNVSELAEILDNIGDTCRQKNTPSLQLNELKRLFREERFETLKNLRPLRKAHPRVTSKEVAEKIIDLGLMHPGWGCIRLSEYLKEEGIGISPPTVQSILNHNGLGKKAERSGALEIRAFREHQMLTPEQIKMIEKINPCFKEQGNSSKRPGQLLVQDVILVGTLKNKGKIFLQAVVDTYTNYAFGRLDLRKVADCAVAMLHNEVLPFYKERQLPVQTILTDNGREYSGKANHHYELYLMLNDIEHRKLPLHQAQTNGFMQRFRKTVLDEFFRKIFQKSRGDSFEDLQGHFSQWLTRYNRELVHPGYPNLGVPPHQLLEDYLTAGK